MILVDSNIWIYHLDAATKEHATVRQRLPPLLDEGLLVPTVVQMEVIHYLVRRLGPEAQGDVETFLSQECEIAPLSSRITLEASRLLIQHAKAGIGGRDSVLLATAQRRDAALATHDRVLADVAGRLDIKTSDPAT